jgi:lipoprotein-releasing system ATP-binding protein
MIEATDIRKSFGKVQVLKGIDFKINKGEIVSIVGASGAGKTTLLQIIGTLNNADSGKIVLDGIETSNLNSKNLASFRNQKIGFVFQFHHLLAEFTALENVCIPAYIKGKSKSEAEKDARRILEFLNLGNREEHKPSELSGGEQQRVAVARALINNPAVILADEPSGNLDSVNKKELHELFFTLRDTYNQTFVIVTHDNGLAEMSDRILHIKDGYLVD